jgi:hypothetical protein
MEKARLILAIGLCVAVVMFPLAGMADNPLPSNDNSDGHPWDDDDNSDLPDDPNDTLPNPQEVSLDERLDGSIGCSFYFVSVWKWYLLLIW